MGRQTTAKVNVDEKGHPLLVTKGDFLIRQEADDYQAIFFDGDKTHEGPESPSPSQALEVLVFELDEQEINWRDP